MVINKCTKQIACDICGCKNKADYFIKKDKDSSDYYSLKLCNTCIEEIKKLLSSINKKEKNNDGEKNSKNG